MNIDVTVAISIFKAEKYIYDCVESLLSQNFDKFEIVIVEDLPFDESKKILEKFRDKRIRYYRNKKHLGLSKSRNICIDLSRGKYIFFTDSDCIVTKNWIEEGVKYFEKFNCIGVEGKLFYVSENYSPTFSDGIYIRENKKGGSYMTANIAYKKNIFIKIGKFDEKYSYLEDRDLGLRAKKIGKILFNPDMIVYHQKITLDPYEYIKTGKEIRNRVLLYKKFGEKNYIYWRVVYPLNLLAIFFPPLILGTFIYKKYKSKKDYTLFLFMYIRLIYERLNLWYMCIKERVFLI
jgi:GT2 family glycosyltransferase